jgi:hypothetical protein
MRLRERTTRRPRDRGPAQPQPSFSSRLPAERATVRGHSRMTPVLCASSYCSERLMRLFKRDSWFRIYNTIDFANAVSRHVPGSIQGAEGLCIDEGSLQPCRTPAVERPHRGEGRLRAAAPEERQLCMPGRVPDARPFCAPPPGVSIVEGDTPQQIPGKWHAPGSTSPELLGNQHS